MFHDWWRFRELFSGLVVRDLKVRYRGSALGFFWTVLNPLLLMGVYTLIFSVFMRTPVSHYPIFVFCGLLPWHWLNGALSMAAGSIRANSGIVKKIYFPTELLPLIAVTSNLINFALSLGLLGVFMVVYHVAPTPAIMMLPLVLAVQFIFTSSLALLLALLNTFFRDIEHMLPVALMVWFYATPIVYPASVVPERFSWLLTINPMHHLISSYRAILLEGAWPTLPGLIGTLLASLAFMAVVFAVFNRHKFRFAEVI